MMDQSREYDGMAIALLDKAELEKSSENKRNLISGAQIYATLSLAAAQRVTADELTQYVWHRTQRPK